MHACVGIYVCIYVCAHYSIIVHYVDSDDAHDNGLQYAIKSSMYVGVCVRMNVYVCT
jgi:hypothetical protein